jgi:hypothetical protein
LSLIKEEVKNFSPLLRVPPDPGNHCLSVIQLPQFWETLRQVTLGLLCPIYSGVDLSAKMELHPHLCFQCLGHTGSIFLLIAELSLDSSSAASALGHRGELSPQGTSVSPGVTCHSHLSAGTLLLSLDTFCFSS